MKKWLKCIIPFIIFAIISIGIFLLLKLFGLADINKLKNIVENSNQYGLIIYFLIMTTCLTVLCFVPLLNTSLIVLGILLFKPFTTFYICIISTFVATTILFVLGKYCGKKIATKLVGKDDFSYVENLISQNGKFALPILYILPGFPDEALALVSGVVGIKFWYLAVICTLYHIVELGLFCFLGSGIIDWSCLSTFDWIILINLLIFDIIALFKLENRMNKKK